jgi:hypothetical protein
VVIVNGNILMPRAGGLREWRREDWPGAFSSPPQNEREHIQMMLKITCPCGHVGPVAAETLAA